MKRIFTSFISLLVFPFQFFKKSRIDNFLGGLIVGALFSLVVNLFTLYVQELISRQHILEAIEYEIWFNSQQAEDIILSSAKKVEDNELPNMFYMFPRYSRDLWTQSSEPLQYLTQLPSSIQSEIVIYYSMAIPMYNSMIETLTKFDERHMNSCYPLGEFTNKEIEEDCRLLYQFLLRNNASTAQLVYENSNKILDMFHPTEDRLKSPLLKLLMGTDSLRILSGK